MTDDKVLIYATGPDSELRLAMFALLRANLASDIDRIDQGSMIITDAGKEKLSSLGVAFAIVTHREHIQSVFQRLRGIAGTRAYAVPIVDAM